MLALMRRLTQNKLTGGFLLGLVVLSMAVWGTNDIFSGSIGSNIIQAGERGVTEQQLNRKFENYLNNLRLEQPGNAITRQQAAQQGILDQIFNVERSRLTSLGFARQLGADSSAQALADDVRAIGAFQNPLTNEFDDQYYRNALAGIRVTPKEFETDTQDRLTLDYLRESIEAATVPPVDIARVQAIFDGEERYIAWVPIEQAALPPIADPTEEELQAFYDERAQAFASPERRRFSMLNLSAADFLHQAVISEQDILNYYEATKNRRLATPEQRTFLEAVFPDEDSAKNAFGVLAVGGELPEQAGALISTRTSAAEAVAIDEFRNILFAPNADEGAVAGPFETDGNWIVGRLIEIIPGEAKPLEEVRDEVRAEIAAEQAEIAFYTSQNDLDDLLAQGLSLEEIGTEFGTPVVSFAPVDTRAVTSDAAFLQAITVSPEAFAQGFQLSAGQITDRFDGDVSSVLLSIDEIIPQNTPPLSENRERAERSYRNVREGEILREALDAIKVSVDAGTATLDSVAEQHASTIERPERGLRRTAPDRTLPQAVLQSAFSLEEGQTAIVQGRSLTELILVKLETIERPETSELDVLAPLSAPKIAEQINNDILFAFDDAVQDAMDIKTNDAIYNAYKTRIIEDQ